MKKLFVAIVMLASVVGTAYASGGAKIDRRVEAAFQQEFAGARAVRWEVIKKENIYQAKFIYNNERINAFFEEDGTLIATGRYIPVSTMPLLIRKSVYKKYSGYQVTEVVEYVKENETSYLVHVENSKVKMLLHAYNSGAVYVFKKEKKNDVAKL